MYTSNSSRTCPRTDPRVGLTSGVNLGIIIPLIVLPVVLIGAVAWYRRSMADLRPEKAKPVSGVRLTAEMLHRLGSPPWRIVYEIGPALGGVDHVIVGPPGVIAVSTTAADRPPVQRLLDTAGNAQLMADAAIARGPVDELARPAGVACQLSARVYWGAPDNSRPAFEEVASGLHLVEGQRLAEWLDALRSAAAPDLQPTHVDLAWQSIVMGIGRPNPLI